MRDDRVRQRQPLLRPRHADVAEPPLLLDPLLLDRARVREDPLLHPDHEHGAELEALRVVQRHQRDEAAPRRGSRPGRSTSEISWRKLDERRLLAPARLVLPRDADELLQVLDPPLRLDRPLGLERLEVARLRSSTRSTSSGTLAAPARAPCSDSIRRAERATARSGARRRRPPRIGRAPPRARCRAVGVRREPRERRVADPAARPVGDPQQRDRVERVVEHLEVRDESLISARS